MTYIYFTIYLFKHENILLWILIFEVAIATSLVWRIFPLMGPFISYRLYLGRLEWRNTPFIEGKTRFNLLSSY